MMDALNNPGAGTAYLLARVGEGITTIPRLIDAHLRRLERQPSPAVESTLKLLIALAVRYQ